MTSNNRSPLNTIQPWSGPAVIGLGCLAVFLAGCGDRALFAPSDSHPEASFPPSWDAATPRSDLPAIQCGQLSLVSGAIHVTERHTRQALISRMVDRVVLLTHEDNGPGELLSVALPAGETISLGAGYAGMEWLGDEQVLLAQYRVTASGPYELRLLPVQGGESTTVATEVCHHQVTADGQRIYIVRQCTEAGGTLEVIELPSMKNRILFADEVNPSKLTISPDGNWTAFIVHDQHVPSASCQHTTYLAHYQGQIQSITTQAVDGPVQFLSQGGLLLQAWSYCPEGGVKQLLFVASPSQNIPKVIAEDYICLLENKQDKVSPDGKLLLGTLEYPPRTGPGMSLYTIHTDGSGTILLTNDLFFVHFVTRIINPAAFSTQGDHIVYVSTPVEGSFGAGLTVIPVDGGQKTMLSMGLQGNFILSPDGETVVYQEGTHKTVQLRLGTIRTGHSELLREQAGNLEIAVPDTIRFLPDHRGIIYVEQQLEKKEKTLRFISGPGESAFFLGQWSNSMMNNWHGYQLDPHGCVVLFDTDLGEQPGTYLAAIF